MRTVEIGKILLYALGFVCFTVLMNLALWLYNPDILFNEVYSGFSFLFTSVLYLVMLHWLLKSIAKETGQLITAKKLFITFATLSAVVPILNAIAAKFFWPIWAKGATEIDAQKQQYLDLINDSEMILLNLLSFVVLILVLNLFYGFFNSQWHIFKKLSKKGWYSLVPFVNQYHLLDISRKPQWWMLWFFIPIANVITYILVLDGLAKRFGQNSSFTVGLILLPFIFFPILGYDKYPSVTKDEISQIGTE